MDTASDFCGIWGRCAEALQVQLGSPQYHLSSPQASLLAGASFLPTFAQQLTGFVSETDHAGIERDCLGQ